MIMQQALNELREALAAHDASYPNGDWKAANVRIAKARNGTDSLLFRAGLLPNRPIGNDKALELLGQLVDG